MCSVYACTYLCAGVYVSVCVFVRMYAHVHFCTLAFASVSV